MKQWRLDAPTRMCYVLKAIDLPPLLAKLKGYTFGGEEVEIDDAVLAGALVFAKLYRSRLNDRPAGAHARPPVSEHLAERLIQRRRRARLPRGIYVRRVKRSEAQVIFQFLRDLFYLEILTSGDATF